MLALARAQPVRALHRPLSLSAPRNMKVIPVPVRSDNYAYLLVDEKTNTATAVDVYDVPKVQAAAAEAGVQITAALTTHHHDDHSGGNKAFAKAYPDAPIYGGSNRAPALTNLVKDKDEFTLGETLNVECLATPCHTQDSICYYVTASDASHPGGVFTGDTLFIAGCGRFFEGTATEMNAALSYLATLPDTTVTYNGHEYTKGNLAFAKSVEATDALQRLDALVAEHPITTGRTTIADEKAWNPFMRLQSAAIRESIGATASTDDNDIMQTLRDKKNSFRG